MPSIFKIWCVNPRTRQLIQHTRLCLFSMRYAILCSIKYLNLCMIFLKFSLFVFYKNIKKIKIILYMINLDFKHHIWWMKFLNSPYFYLSASATAIFLYFGCSCWCLCRWWWAFFYCYCCFFPFYLALVTISSLVIIIFTTSIAACAMW